ncbi:MAG TPA: 50S ribosomal protein L3 N(5)-glutamine methyltransferase [Burkholderiales bacterium]
MKLAQLVEKTEKRFKAAGLHYGHGTGNARDEAAFLVIRGLGLPFDVDLEQDVAEKDIESLVRRRIRNRIPAAYLLNEAWLDGVPFYVDERVIVPRSHIAFLLGNLNPPRRVLDLCTGSGCLAVLAARAFPDARVVASDISPAALEVAEKNVIRHRLQHRIRLVRSDLFAATPGRFDLILSNPPYVDAPAMRRLTAEYRREPELALAAGKDGLTFIRKILQQAPSYLAPSGILLCEVGDSRRALERAFPRLRFTWPAEFVFLLRREEIRTTSLRAIPRAAGRRGSRAAAPPARRAGARSRQSARRIRSR